MLLWIRVALCALITIASASATNASSSAAMPTCKSGDPVVWVNTSSHVYHLQGDKYYGNTKAGKYACESDAVASGAHASGAKTKGASASSAAAMPSPVPSTKPKHHHASASPAPAAT